MECNCTVTIPGPSLATCGGSTLSVFMLMLEQFLGTQCDIADPCGQITSCILPEDDTSVKDNCSENLFFTIGQSKSNIGDPPHQINPCTTPILEFDFIVVGGGTAGSVVANRLSEVPDWNVLLVEPGPNEPNASQVPSFWQNAQNTSVDWQFVTEPESTAFLNNGGSCLWSRGKVIGGTSGIDCMIYIRGNRKDYDHWQLVGNAGWSYQDVLPYFIKSEDNLQTKDTIDKGYHGVGGYLPVSQFKYLYPIEKDFIQGAKEMGQTISDFNGENQIGFAFAQATSKNGIRFSAARAFLRPVLNRTNLYIALKTCVIRVLIDETTKKAIGVEVYKDDCSTGIISCKKEVIICAGAINSPKVLLLSGIGDTEQLKDVGVTVVHHLPGVGRNLQDHVGYRTVFTTNHTNVNDLNWAVAMTYLLFRDGEMSTNGNSVIGFIQTKYVNKSENWPDIMIQLQAHEARCSETGTVNEIAGGEVDGEVPKKKLFMKSALIQPKSRGYLTLRDNSHFTYPKIYPGYLSNPADIPPIIEGIKFILKLSQSDALRKYDLKLDQTPVPGCEFLDFGSDEYWTCAIRRETVPIFNQAGTCKMGPESDPEAVVDPQLRVRGVQGLRVVDGSIMPKVVAGGSIAPILMVAEKASDMIKKHHCEYTSSIEKKKKS